jgi:hypothetical protein
MVIATCSIPNFPVKARVIDPIDSTAGSQNAFRRRLGVKTPVLLKTEEEWGHQENRGIV